jgi:hypothetical protein
MPDKSAYEYTTMMLERAYSLKCGGAMLVVMEDGAGVPLVE